MRDTFGTLDQWFSDRYRHFSHYFSIEIFIWSESTETRWASTRNKSKGLRTVKEDLIEKSNCDQSRGLRDFVF